MKRTRHTYASSRTDMKAINSVMRYTIMTHGRLNWWLAAPTQGKLFISSKLEMILTQFQPALEMYSYRVYMTYSATLMARRPSQRLTPRLLNPPLCALMTLATLGFVSRTEFVSKRFFDLIEDIFCKELKFSKQKPEGGALRASAMLADVLETREALPASAPTHFRPALVITSWSKGEGLLLSFSLSDDFNVLDLTASSFRSTCEITSSCGAITLTFASSE
ncbi:unnamed protein product [Spodoptera exigua]|nr:unnamed protein product [Spodoptera exigua]